MFKRLYQLIDLNKHVAGQIAAILGVFPYQLEKSILESIFQVQVNFGTRSLQDVNKLGLTY